MAGERRTQKGRPPVAESAAALLQAQDTCLEVEDVEIPEWGLSVKVRGLTRGELRHIASDEVSAHESNVYALTRALVQPVVSEDDAERLLDEKSIAATDRILSRIMEKSGTAPGFREGQAD